MKICVLEAREVKFLCIKITERKYAEAFRAGQVYMNSLQHFRGTTDEQLRGDIFEGIYGSVGKRDIPKFGEETGFRLDEKLIEMMVGDLLLVDEGLKYTKLFCMYMLQYSPVENTIKRMDKRILEFGDTFVIIKDLDELHGRMVSTMNKRSKDFYGLEDAAVEYLSMEEGTRHWGPFKKTNNYEWQQEYRFALHPNTNSKEFTTEASCLELGDLTDITVIGEANELWERTQKDFKYLEEFLIQCESK